MACSKRKVDSFTSFAPILPLSMIALNFLSSFDAYDISVGKLFVEKNELILQLCKVVFRDKFDFKIARSTTTRFEAIVVRNHANDVFEQLEVRMSRMFFWW